MYGYRLGYNLVQKGALLKQTPLHWNDGNTIFYDKDLSVITTIDENKVSKWADYYGSGNDLEAITSPDGLPTLTPDGVSFDGVLNHLIKVFSLPQPCMIYMVVNPITFNSGASLFFSTASPNSYASWGTISPYIRLNAGVSLGQVPAIMNTQQILRVILNGANSKIQIDADTPLIGDAGTNGLQGFSLGANKAGAGSSNIIVNSVAIRTIIDSESEDLASYNYLKKKVIDTDKMITIGDSVTRQALWQPTIVTDYAPLLWYLDETDGGTDGHSSMGVSSSKIVPLINDAFEGQQLGNSIYERADDVKYYNGDLILLFGGYNDHPDSIIGTVNDAVYTGNAVYSSPPTFYSAYKGTLKKIKEQNPSARVVCISPAYRIGQTEILQQNFVDAIENCADAYNLQFIDLLNNSGITAANQATYLADGLHPNALGGELVGAYIAAQL